jgi:hypothetical protein
MLVLVINIILTLMIHGGDGTGLTDGVYGVTTRLWIHGDQV